MATSPLVRKPHVHMMRVKRREYFQNKYWHRFECDKDNCKEYRLVEVGYFQ